MEIIELTKENFEHEVLLSELPVLIDFWADWCGPCKMLAPVIEELANEAKNFKVAKVNIDEQQEMAAAFGVMSIPMVAAIKGDQILNMSVGVKPKEELLKLLESKPQE